MEEKQTAIDYLKKQYELRGYISKIDFEQAKKFEEEQMKNSFNCGIGLDGLIDDCSAIFIKYYEETYGNAFS